MRQIRDEIYHYPGFGGAPSHCRLRVWRDPDFAPVVIVYELDDNPGTSVTNRAELLAWQVWNELERPRPFNYFESYTRPDGERTYDEVQFDLAETGFFNPQWLRWEADDVVSLLGQQID